jgi:hypothetical protein
MARPTAAPAKPAKEPGRLAQMWQVFSMTRRYDKAIVPILIAALLVPIVVAVLLSVFVAAGNPVVIVLYIVAGVLAGVLLALILLGRRAEKAAYGQIEGQPGAVGAVLKNSLRRSWRASELPVNVSPRTQDAVYRAVGRGGVVLIGEGPKSRTKRMLDDENRKVARIVPNVTVNYLYVGPDADATPLYQVARRLNRFKPSLSRAEVVAVSNRLASLSRGANLPIPKGIDPNRVRAPRPR